MSANGDSGSSYRGNCASCGSSEFAPFRLDLVKCQICGLVVSPGIWNPQSNALMEEMWFGDDYQPETSFWVRWFEASNNRRTLSRLAGLGVSAKKLLEIGVGSGSFLYEARRRGYVVTGCDLSKAICGRVSEAYGIPMHCGALTELPRGKFDIVVMNHVLEHTNDPLAFLSDVKDLLKLGGVVHIAVPNVACWEALLPGWNSYEPYHLSYFTPDTLRKLLSAAGLEVKQFECLDSFSAWFLAILRTFLGFNRNGRVEKSSQAAGRWSGGKSRALLIEHSYRLAMVSAGVLTWPLRKIQSLVGRGDEIIFVVRLK